LLRSNENKCELLNVINIYNFKLIILCDITAEHETPQSGWYEFQLPITDVVILPQFVGVTTRVIHNKHCLELSKVPDYTHRVLILIFL